VKNMHAVAAAAVLLTSQVYAANSILQSNLTATPSGQSDGREIHFKLPINGDTKNCVVNITYGEKAGVGANNDGDTHINGQGNVDRSRTYQSDGTYTFTARAKSGCTGEAHVTFTIGKNARTAVDAPVRSAPPVTVAPATPSVNSGSGLVVTPAKITSVEVTPKLLYLGASFTVTVNGTGAGDLKQCVSGIYLDKLVDPQVYGYAVSYNHFNLPTYANNGPFPRKTTFTPSEEGTYQVRLIPAGNSGCGLDHLEKIPGSLTNVVVTYVAK
jgi:hypothetical protein